MLRYWYKLNGDSLNYGIGNEKFISGGEYSELYPKFFYKNALIYNGKSAANVPADPDLVYTLTEPLTKYSISGWYYVYSSHTNHGNDVHMIKLINETNYSYIDLFWNPLVAPRWTHFCLTYDGLNLNVYINGVLTEETLLTNLLMTGLGFMHRDEVKGALTDLKIFDHVVSNKEIEELATPLLVHLPFNYICIPSLNLNEYIPGRGYINCTSTLTKDTINYTGNIPSLDPEYIIDHQGEYIVASAYIWSLGSYTKSDAVNHAYFGPELVLQYTNNNNVHKIAYGFPLLRLNRSGFVYSHFKIPDDIKSIIECYIADHTLRTGTTRPDLYGVTWTFSHFKVEPGQYPSYPFRYYGFEDITGHNYDGTTQFMNACACINDSPRYKTGVRLYGKTGGIIGNIFLFDFRDNYGQMDLHVGFTMSIWFKINNIIGSGNTEIFSYYDDTDESGFILHANENAFFLNQYVHNDDTVIGTVVKPCNTNTWYHCALSCNSTEFKLYINGVLLNLSNSSGVIADFTNDSLIGINRAHNTDMSVSDFRMYKTCLSDLKIKDIYNEASSIDNNGDVFSRELYEYEYINHR